MFVLSLIPLIFGYVVTRRLVGEREGHLSLPVTYGLGLSCFLFSVNAVHHVLSLRATVFLTLALMAVVSVALWPLKAPSVVWLRLGRLEAGLVVTLALTAFFYALFWQMQRSDDDFTPHAALMGLYLRDIFPPHNPLYPDQPYLGHYGRDLGISALSVLWNERFFAVQYAVTSLNHGMTVLLAYFASRRFLRSRRQALLAVILIFLGFNPYLGRNLLDVFTNNNTFAYLFLFLNVYLFFSALRAPRPGVIVLSALTLATYGIVYTTHHGVLVLAFCAFALAVVIRSRRWRTARLVAAAAIVAGAVAVGLVQGGTLTEVGHRYLLGERRPQVSAPAENALATQQVSIHFPKNRLGFTAFDGTPYSLFSWQSLWESSFAVAFLPVLVPLLFARHRYWALLFALIAATAILVPATVDFGAFENDSYRLLFLGGLAAALALGSVVGLVFDRMGLAGRIPRLAMACLGALLIVVCSSSIVRATALFLDVARRPQQYPWGIEQWACNTVYWEICDPVDVTTAIALRRLVKAGDSILTNVYDESDTAFIAHSLIGALARGFVGGHGARVSVSAATTGQEWKRQAGYRAIAFWGTGAPGLLDELHPDWLLVDPSRLSRHVRAALDANPQLTLVYRESDPVRGGTREVYRVRPSEAVAGAPPPRDLTLVSVGLPEELAPARLLDVPIVIETHDPSFSGRLRLGIVVRAGAVVVNRGDVVREEVQLRRGANGRWTGTLHLVSPFEPGDYQIEVVTAPDDAPVPGPTGGAGIWRLSVA